MTEGNDMCLQQRAQQAATTLTSRFRSGHRTVTLAGAVLMLTAAACTSGLPSLPTPGPFPVEGVRQLTYDAAFYQNLVWSPDGRKLAAGRCPILNAEPACMSQEEAVLIDAAGGGAQALDLSPLGEGKLTSWPVTWSPDGTRLLLVARKQPGTSPSFYIEWSVANGGLRRLDIGGTAIAWDKAGERLLVVRAADTNELALGWLSTQDGSFQQEISYPASEPHQGFYALSPDQTLLLIGDSPLPSTCDTIYEYRMGSREQVTSLSNGVCLPAWSPGGHRIAFLAPEEQPRTADRLFVMRRDGSDVQPVFAGGEPGGIGSPAWSPDGGHLAFTFLSTANVAAVYLAEVPSGLRD